MFLLPWHVLVWYSGALVLNPDHRIKERPVDLAASWPTMINTSTLVNQIFPHLVQPAHRCWPRLDEAPGWSCPKVMDAWWYIVGWALKLLFDLERLKVSRFYRKLQGFDRLPWKMTSVRQAWRSHWLWLWNGGGTSPSFDPSQLAAELCCANFLWQIWVCRSFQALNCLVEP